MATVRLTVTPPADERAPAELASLAADLRASMVEGQHLTRSAGLSLPGAPSAAGGPDRIFTLDVPDGDLATGTLRALGGWLMRHPSARVAIKADGPSGGVSLRLAGWSAVAFAAAVARIQQQLVEG